MDLNQSLHGGRYMVDCLIFSYASYSNEPQWIHDMDNSKSARCEIVRMHKLGFVYFIKMLAPFLLRDAGYKYIFLSLDDVALTAKYEASFDLTRFFDIMESQGLQVASCAIEGTVHKALRPQMSNRTDYIGRYITMIELQATAFELKAWEFMYELIDTEYPSGWGLDIWFWDFCVTNGRIKELKMGVIDIMKVVHNPFRAPSRNSDTKDPRAIMNEQARHWADERGVKLTGSTYIQTLGYMFGNNSTRDV